MKEFFKPVPTVFTRVGLVMELVKSIKRGGLKFAIYSVQRDDEYLGAELHIVRKAKEDHAIKGRKVWIKGTELLAQSSEFGSYGWYFKFFGRNFPEKEAEEKIDVVIEKRDKKKRMGDKTTDLSKYGVRLDG